MDIFTVVNEIVDEAPSVTALEGLSIASSSRGIDLWEKALQSLDPRDRAGIDLVEPKRLAVLNSVLEAARNQESLCIQNQWKYERQNGDKVILRDVFAKIAGRILKFKSIGDAAVKYDPSGYAALPWAVVSGLLQISVNDVQSFGAMTEGLELVLRLTTRYELIERFYLERESGLETNLSEALITLYAVVLKYLGTAKRFFAKNAAKRWASGILNPAQKDVQNFLDEAGKAQADVDVYTRFVSAKYSEEERDAVQSISTALSSMGKKHKEDHEELKLMLHQLDEPLIRQASQLSKIQDSLERSEREKILQWMSEVPYTKHHKTKSKERLANSGAWLLESSKFVEWQESSSSSIFWLHGIPGAGKSMLTSSVIDKFLRPSDPALPPAPIAYFYCARNNAEPERANPTEILRAILKQLSSLDYDTPIREPVVEAFEDKVREAKGASPDKLMLDECVDLILVLLQENPAVIVLDALDECDGAERYHLLDALDEIIEAALNLVQVFVSSRNDGDICDRFELCLNIDIQAADNEGEIRQFVHEQVNEAIKKRRLLKGKVNDVLREHIMQTLIENAGGMFRLVSLHIQNLCNPKKIKCEEDVKEELKMLPASLTESYNQIHADVLESGSNSLRAAQRAFKWLLVSQRQLAADELLIAIALDEDTGKYVPRTHLDLLDICFNLVVLDSEFNVFRFAHLSVREYFEGLPEYDVCSSHNLVLSRCLDSYILWPTIQPDQEGLHDYPITHWPIHCRAVGNIMDDRTAQKLQQFLFTGDEVSEAFIAWLKDLDVVRYDTGLPGQWIHNSIASPPTPLFVASAVGMISVLEKLGQKSNTDWKARNDFGRHALWLAAESGHADAVQFLLMQGVDAEIAAPYDGNRLLPALHVASLNGHDDVVWMLVSSGVSVKSQCSLGMTPLHYAVYAESQSEIQLLLEHGANLEAQDARGKTPLYHAAELGLLDVCRLFIQQGANVDAAAYDGRSLIHTALESKDEEILNLLLENKANSNLRDSHQMTPLHFTICHVRDDQMVKILLENQADINAKNEDGNTALHLIAQQYDIYAAYLDRAEWEKPDASKSSVDSRSPQTQGQEQGVADDSESDGEDSEPEKPVVFLPMGAEADPDGCVKLEKILKVLLVHDLDTTIRNNEGQTAIEIAQGFHLKPLVKLLEEVEHKTRNV